MEVSTMTRIRVSSAIRKALLLVGFFAGVSASLSAQTMRTSRTFTGPKANTGTVSVSKVNGSLVLTLSSDFTVPDSPDPHWQVVDSKGAVYLLQRLDVKPGAMSPGAMLSDATKGAQTASINRSITLPSYIHDVAKVQIWCGFAETLLGEAPFDSPQD
jgi:hypothetical protein